MLIDFTTGVGPVGTSILTASVCGGIVMMNMISNTSITSISGVVFMSAIGGISAREKLAGELALMVGTSNVITASLICRRMI